MLHLLLFFVFFLNVIVAQQCCPNGASTLLSSYTSSTEVFSGKTNISSMVGGRIAVYVLEVFKSESGLVRLPTVQPIWLKSRDCGSAFPYLRPNAEIVFFANYTTSRYSYSYYGTLILNNCTRTGALSYSEKQQLRNFAKSCTSPTGILIPDGYSTKIQCHMCRCNSGKFQCPTTPCYSSPTPTITPSPTPSYATSMGCRDEGNYIADGATEFRRSSCQQCVCNRGFLSCVSGTCCIGPDGVRRGQGETWWYLQNSCQGFYTCTEGNIRELPHGSGASYCTKQQQLPDMLIVGTSLTGGFLVVLVVWMVVIARRRMQAMAEPREIPLDDRDDSDADVSAAHPYSSVQTQPFSNFYNHNNNNTTHGLQTTPMVLMTQTGEPVVVQVAYI